MARLASIAFGRNMPPMADELVPPLTAYKNADLVKRCVDSLRTVFGGKLHETVIVDDAAGDSAIAELVASYVADGVKSAEMPENSDFAGANNLG